MKRGICVFGLWRVGGMLLAQSFTLSGGAHLPYIYTPDASTGLQKVFVTNGFAEAQLSFTSATQNMLRWFSYTQRASDLTPLEGSQTGNVTVLTSPLATHTGYVVQDGDRRYYVWVFDYSTAPSVLTSIKVADSGSLCDGISLAVNHRAPPLLYYTIAGVRKTLEREYTLTHTTMEFNETNRRFQSTEIHTPVKGEFTTLSVKPPYCNTDFGLKGDQFSLFFNLPSEVKSEVYTAVAVALKTEALQGDTVRTEGELGGSAPMEIVFEAYVNDPLATFYRWEYSDDPTFSSLLATYPDPAIRLHFDRTGIYYVRCTASNRDNSCATTSGVYTILVSDSYLRVPNAFSPGASPGINDEFKPRCKSLVSFEAHIFNKWGVELYRWSDPNGGWDGKHNGDYVLPGPYYYVIKATGADGKQYNLKGDVNVMRGEEEAIKN